MNIVLVPGYMLDDDLWADVAEDLAQVGSLSHADLSRDATIEGMAQRCRHVIRGRHDMQPGEAAVCEQRGSPDLLHVQAQAEPPGTDPYSEFVDDLDQQA